MLAAEVDLSADLDTPMDDGATPSFIASHNGHAEVPAFLIERSTLSRFVQAV